MERDNIIKALNYRYATKQFDTTKWVSTEDLDTLIESMRLAPSSFGLQWWWFIIVSNPELKEKITANARNQQQIIQAPYLIVLCRRTNVDSDYIHSYIESISNTRNIPQDQLAWYEAMMNWAIGNHDEHSKWHWLHHQVYIALGFLLETAALLWIDACPMEGFDRAAIDDILELKEHNLSSCVITPIGYRSADDIQSSFTKVRWAKEDVVIIK